MKHMRWEVIPEKVQGVVDRTTCDLCEATIANKGYNIDEVRIEHRNGTAYPECGYGTETTFDLCSRCFTEKLVPWLKSQGAEPSKSSMEY